MAIVNPESEGATKSAPRTAPKEARRLQLIQATIESIGKYGISGTTMKTVTGIAGLSMGIVNFHFDNKDTLFQETLRFLGEEHRDQWRKGIKSSSLRPEEKLLRIVDAHFHPDICNRKKLAVWFGFYGEAANRAAYREIMSEIDDERWEISKVLCREIIEDGGYAALDPENISDTLEGLYDGFCLNILMYPGVFTRDDARSRVYEYLSSIFPRHVNRPAV